MFSFSTGFYSSELTKTSSKIWTENVRQNILCLFIPVTLYTRKEKEEIFAAKKEIRATRERICLHFFPAVPRRVTKRKSARNVGTQHSYEKPFPDVLQHTRHIFRPCGI